MNTPQSIGNNFVVQIVFDGLAKELLDNFRKFRGYVAVDNVALKNGLECKGHCTFEGGFCGWSNDETDDFNWSLVSEVLKKIELSNSLYNKKSAYMNTTVQKYNQYIST